MQPPACVVFKPDGLGDFILALGAIRLLTNHFGEEQVALVVNAHCQEIARHQFPSATITSIAFTSGHLKADWGAIIRALPSLRHLHGLRVVSLRHQRGRLTQLALAALQPAELFFSENLLQGSAVPHFRSLETWFASRRGKCVGYPDLPPPGLCRELEANRLVTSAMLDYDIAPDEILPTITGLSEVEGTDQLVISAFGSATCKNYPHLVSAVARFLRDSDPDVNAVFLCTATQRLAAESLQNRFAADLRDRVRIITPPTVIDLVETISRARAVLTVDTATAHIAVSLDKSAVVLLGGGHFGLYGPWQRSERQRWLYHPLPCFNCFWNCPFDTIRCLDQLSVEQVIEALNAAWHNRHLNHARKY